jgi:hypothetical protein
MKRLIRRSVILRSPWHTTGHFTNSHNIYSPYYKILSGWKQEIYWNTILVSYIFCRKLSWAYKDAEIDWWIHAPENFVLCKIWGFDGGDYEECRLLGCLDLMALVRTDVSEEFSAPIIRLRIIGELGTTLAVTSNRGTQYLSPRWWKRYDPPKRRFLQDPCCVTFQKTFFIVTAVKSSNLT